jgi:hypothetical protein
MDSSTQLLNICNEAQLSKRLHRTNAKKLEVLLKNDKTGNLKKILIYGILDQALIHSKNDSLCHRIVEFFSILMTIVDEAILKEIVEHLVVRLSSTLKIVRVKICDLFQCFFQIASEGELEFSCEILNRISSCLIERLKDKIVAVRVSCVQVLQLLQNVEDPKDEIIRAFLTSLEIDNAVSVRKAIVVAVGLNENTKVILQNRLKDVSHEIRQAVLQRFAEETDIRQFNREARIAIVSNGLNDRNSQVVQATEHLLLKWYELLQQDLLKFLQYFSPFDNEESVCMICSVLCQKFPLSNETANIEDAMSIDYVNDGTSINVTILMWLYVRCIHLSQFGNKFNLMKYIESYLPEVKEAEDLIKSLLNMDHENDTRILYTLKYLLLLIPFIATVTDITGHQRLRETLLTVLNYKTFEEETIFLFSLAAKAMITLDKETISGPKVHDVIVSYISDVIDAHENADNGMVISLYDIHKLYASLQFLLHQFTPQEVAMKVLPYSTHTQKLADIIIRCLQQRDAHLRALAVKVIGLMFTYEEKVRQPYFGLLKQVATGNFEDYEVKSNAIQIVVDILILNQSNSNKKHRDHEENNVDHNNALESEQHQQALFASFLANNVPNLLEADEQQLDLDFSILIVESAVKLMFGIADNHDGYHMSKLLFASFIPPKQQIKDPKFTSLQQLLSVFLSAFIVKHDSSIQSLQASMSLFIHDMILAVKDTLLSIDALSKAVLKLLMICNEVHEKMIVAFQQQSSRNSKEKNEELSAILQRKQRVQSTLQMTAFACVAREILKLDNDLIKRTGKELIKLLAAINHQSAPWLPANEVSGYNIVRRILLNDSDILLERKCTSSFIRNK